MFQPAYYINQVLEYNFTLEEDSLLGNYSIEILNGTGDTVPSYPEYHTSNGLTVAGTILLTPAFSAGQYYLYVKWNDTANSPGRTIRFGSCIKNYYLLNGTNSDFIYKDTSVIVGDVANFTIYFDKQARKYRQ